MSKNKANLTRDDFMRVFSVWNVLRKKRCTRCEAKDLVCDYAKGNSFKCHACLKANSGSVKCSWVAELIEKVVLLSNGEELARRAPKAWLAWIQEVLRILEILRVLGSANLATTANDNQPAPESTASSVQVENAAHKGTASTQIVDDRRIDTEPGDNLARGSTLSTALVDDHGLAEEEDDAPARNDILDQCSSTPLVDVDDDGAGEDREGNRAQDGSPPIDLVDDDRNAEEQGYPSTHEPSPSIAGPDHEGSPMYFRTPSMELPGDLEYPTHDGTTHDGTPSVWVPRSPVYSRSASVEVPDYHDHPPHDGTSHLGVSTYGGSAAHDRLPHIGAREEDVVGEGLRDNRAPGGTSSVGVLDVGGREYRDIGANSDVQTSDAEEQDASHFGDQDEEELKARALELLGEIQDKTEEYIELCNLAELSSRRLPHLIEEATSPKEVSEAAACAAGHLTAARLAKSAAWLAKWEHKETLERLEQLKASRKRTAVVEASPPAKVARIGEVASASTGRSRTHRSAVSLHSARSSASLTSATRRQVHRS